MKLPPEAEGQRWLEQASADLYWAEYLAQSGGFHLACFLAQQVGEKALRAYLYFHGATRYPNALPDSIPARIFDGATAQRAVGLAREIVSFVEARVQR